jgi:hypothetical protein
MISTRTMGRDGATLRLLGGADPLGFAAGDANLYRYVGNDPTDEIDPTGLQGFLNPTNSNPLYHPPYRDPIQGVLGPGDFQMLGPGGQSSYKFPNFTGNPANMIVFIGPPTGSLNNQDGNETYNLKGPYLQSLGVPAQNIFYYNGSDSLQNAVKFACSLGIKNPNVYFWGHAHPGGMLIGNPGFPGFSGTPNDNNNTVESAKQSNWQWFVNLLNQLKPSGSTLVACNFVGQPNSTNRPGNALLGDLANGTNAPASGLIGLEGPWKDGGVWSWNLQKGGSLTTIKPK